MGVLKFIQIFVKGVITDQVVLREFFNSSCSSVCYIQFLQRFFAISSVFLSCSCCVLGCMCLQQVGASPRQADGYVRVSAGYLQVMGTPQTPDSSQDPDLTHGQSHTSTALLSLVMPAHPMYSSGK